MSLERISIELTDYCNKACSFCYNSSSPNGREFWDEDDAVAFVSDCARNGIKAVSFGGGEPLQHDGLFSILERLKGQLFRSLTTNGLLLDQHFEDLVAASPDKIHVSIHYPDDTEEVERVTRQVGEIARRGIASGVNLLVRRSSLEGARQAAERLKAAGIDNRRIVYLPMRISDTPSPDQVADVAGKEPFQSMSCLSACKASPRFCSIASDKSAAWCSYTTARKTLPSLSFKGLSQALGGLELTYCGGSND
ncbi:MAG: radical SAM protein [Candidatus Obscuribacterales bacterium]